MLIFITGQNHKRQVYTTKMICDIKKYIYIHIPKTAGTSIENVLKNIDPPTDTPGSSHTYIKNYKFSLKDKFYDYYRFATVRNPWDRLVSIYSHYKAGGSVAYWWNKCETDKQRERLLNNYPHSIDLKIMKALPETFEEFVYDTSMVGVKMTCLQTDYVMIKGKLEADIIKFENLNQGYAKVAQKLGLPDKLPHTRISKHKHYTEYYNPDTVKHVTETYGEDIECFKYTFGNQT